MESVPIYLLVYYLKIRRHSGEHGYLVTRLEGADVKRATNEVTMLRDLHDLHFIEFTRDEKVLVLDSLARPVEPSVDERPGFKSVIRVSQGFVSLSRARWYWTEVLASALMWLLTAALGAAIGVAATLLIAD